MTAIYILLAIFTGVVLVSLASPTLRRVWVFHVLAGKYLLYALGDLTRIRPLILTITGRRYVKLTRPLALRLFCEDMGVTFVKFGQILDIDPALNLGECDDVRLAWRKDLHKAHS